MIEIKPNKSFQIECPICQCLNFDFEILYPGIRILSHGTCTQCRTEFYQDVPIGFALFYPKSYTTGSKEIFPHFRNTIWFENQLKLFIESKEIVPPSVSIKRKTYKTVSEIVFLNCLDTLYGHVLLKLLNIYYYQKYQPDLGIVVLLPESFEWLLPEGICEAWIVPLKMGQLKYWRSDIDEFVKHGLKQFEKVFISPVFLHPDLQEIEIEKFTKIAPFKLDQYSEKKLKLTFIYREDRLWHNNHLEELMFLISQQSKFTKWIKPLFLYLQNKRINKLLRIIKSRLKEIDFAVAGIGNFGTFPDFVEDLRKTKIEVDTEIQWCEAYASSQMVVGIHGSNMLIPTALSATFVEILPYSRIRNITQDVFGRYSGRKMLFFGRFVNARAGIPTIAENICHLLSNFPAFMLYNSEKYVKFEKIENIHQYSKLYEKFVKPLS